MTVTIRPGGTADFLEVMRVFDWSLLEIDADRVRDALHSKNGRVFVATLSEQVIGAMLTVDSEIVAIAVKKKHRNRGIGSAMIRTAANSIGEVRAEFDEGIYPFYRSLGFSIRARYHDRYEGRVSPVELSDCLDQPFPCVE